MFSPRFLAVLALLAAVAALPTTDKPLPRPIVQITDEDPFGEETSSWFSFPSLSSIFAPFWRLLPSFGDLGPRIISEDNQFKVIVNVKDFKKEDLKVKVKGAFIFVQGSHEAKKEDHDIFASQFFHTYSLPFNSSGADVTAALTSDGFLVVTAPINGPAAKDDKIDREVPIVDTGAPLPTEKPKEEITTLKPSFANAGDRKEPTTLSSSTRDVEPTTPSSSTRDVENENKIPHGNEIL